MIDLACPESCAYLMAAREQASAREADWLPREMAEMGRVPRPEAMRRWLPALLMIAGVIAREQREHWRDMRDADVIAAIDNAVRNLETESSGLIYEHPAESPGAQALSQRLRETLKKLEESERPELRLTPADLLAALKRERDRVQAHMHHNAADSRSYLRHVTLFYPWPEETTKPLIA